MSRRHGVLVDWNDARGFGFIQPSDGGSRVFVHVNEFSRGPRPSAGRQVSFVVQQDGRGRTQAGAVEYRGLRLARSRRTETVLALGLSSASLVLVAVLAVVGAVPVTIAAAYGLLSVVSSVAYVHDKLAARRGRWRTSESTLHLLDAAGGWPGALAARHLLRHKTRKQPFRAVFWLTVVVNCAAAAWFVHDAPVLLP